MGNRVKVYLTFRNGMMREIPRTLDLSRCGVLLKSLEMTRLFIKEAEYSGSVEPGIFDIRRRCSNLHRSRRRVVYR
jgi:hypothetical protein